MSRFSPTVLPETYVNQNPGADFAAAIHSYRTGKRQEHLDTQAEEDRRRRMEREDVTNPMEDALRRVALANAGVEFPGEYDQGTTGGGEPEFTLPSRGTPNMTPSFRPQTDMLDRRLARGVTGEGDMLDRGGAGGGIPGHMRPGAFNPMTQSHNPADINLGGGYSMAGGETPQGRRGRAASQLTAANIPGITPGLALYLSEHPEHIAPIMQAMREGRESPYGESALAMMREREGLQHTNRMGELQYERNHPPAGPKNEMTVAGALEEVDRLYGTRDVQGNMTGSRLNPSARMRLGQRMTRPDFNSEELGPAAGFGGTAGQGARGPGGATPKRHISQDQQAYLESVGKFDPELYIVDPD